MTIIPDAYVWLLIVVMCLAIAWSWGAFSE
jgi:hypothetical protein